MEAGQELAGQELAQSPLLSGLPDDLAILCIAKVPRSYHHNLRRVSKRWRLLVCSEEWWLHRHKNNLHEPWIYAVCEDAYGACLCFLDPTIRCWKRIHNLPPSCQSKHNMSSQVIGKKLYILGGTGRFKSSQKVYGYDVSTYCFEEACQMSSSRFYFSCEAVNGKLYVIGGNNDRRNNQIVWEIFDPSMNKWTTRSDPLKVVPTHHSFAHDGKMYVRCAKIDGGPEKEVLMLHPATSNKWEPVEGNMVNGWVGPIVVVNGTLYMLDQGLGLKMMMWSEEAEDWVTLGRLSTHRIQPPCFLAAAGAKIYVISSSLHTVVIDVNNLGNVPGTLVSSYIAGLSGVEVLCCSTVSL